MKLKNKELDDSAIGIQIAIYAVNRESCIVKDC